MQDDLERYRLMMHAEIKPKYEDYKNAYGSPEYLAWYAEARGNYYSDIQEDNTLAIAQKCANSDCSSPLKGKVKKPKPDRSILWAALAIGGGIYALVYGSHLVAMWLAR